ncbi:MAG: ATP-dependent Clp protease proteolytic subunit [Myxococcota bacterium]
MAGTATTNSERQMSYLHLEDEIEKKLLDQRRVMLAEPVSSRSATDVVRRLMYLEAVDPGKPILFIINSPGGSVDAGFAVWDQIEMIQSPVTTLVTGLAASMGSVLSLAAAPGRRFSTPNARIMIHQPSISGAMEGQATDLEIQAKEILRTRDRLIELYVKATGRSTEEIAQALDRDKWMGAMEAKEYGLLDAVVNSYGDLGM